jgi:hypothetical protein
MLLPPLLAELPDDEVGRRKLELSGPRAELLSAWLGGFSCFRARASILPKSGCVQEKKDRVEIPKWLWASAKWLHEDPSE